MHPSHLPLACRRSPNEIYWAGSSADHNPQRQQPQCHGNIETSIILAFHCSQLLHSTVGTFKRLSRAVLGSQSPLPRVFSRAIQQPLGWQLEVLLTVFHENCAGRFGSTDLSGVLAQAQAKHQPEEAMHTVWHWLYSYMYSYIPAPPVRWTMPCDGAYPIACLTMYCIHRVCISPI